MPTLPRSPHRCLILVVLLAIAQLTACGRGTQEDQAHDPSTAVPSAGEAKEPSADGERGRRADEQKHPRVRIETSLGDIVVRLDAKKAVLTVNNFLRYANEGHYDGMIFHEVSPAYALIGGEYTEDLTQRPPHVSVRNEAHNGLKNLRGTIAMARESQTIDSATSVFFINLADNSHLDHRDETPDGYGYCVFGKVVEGMDVADRIGQVAVHETATKDGTQLQRLPVEPVVIKSMRVLP